jgi:NAD(P)-dependent dehydrogenase (short-subunit alcohol dehydrogenase family)
MAGLRRFQGKCVVVTGASSAIGAATARAFAREGAHIALVAHRPEHLALVALEIRGAGGEGLIFPMDASDVSELPRRLNDVFARLGAIDVLVNAGGWRGGAPRLDLAIPFALTCLALTRVAARGAAIISVSPGEARVAVGRASLCFVRADARADVAAETILRCAAAYGV